MKYSEHTKRWIQIINFITFGSKEELEPILRRQSEDDETSFEELRETELQAQKNKLKYGRQIFPRGKEL